MRFMNEEHEDFYNNCVEKAHCSNDPYRKAFFYTLGLTQDCREGIKNIPKYLQNDIAARDALYVKLRKRRAGEVYKPKILFTNETSAE